MRNEIQVAKKIIEDSWIKIFEALELVYGLDWKNDPNFQETPHRIAKALLTEKCIGINSEEKCERLLSKTFPTSYNGIISSGPIDTFSLCPHHFETVQYKVFVGYIPNGKAVGLSKIPRSVKLFSCAPILQEDLTENYIALFQKCVEPAGSIIVVRGQHGCMSCRGVMVNRDFYVTTSSVRGEFETCDSIKQEFFKINHI
jgi:GTP cyclohydrolase I